MKYYVVQKANNPLMGVSEYDYSWIKELKDYVLICVCENEKECERLLIKEVKSYEKH